ncbi:hypothetical protein TNCV_698881 [Trichonephila clavipes]|nr:hypothetical protein TNCV_698881 [Trichonephila clavipes]
MTRSVPKSPRVAEQCDVNIQLLIKWREIATSEPEESDPVDNETDEHEDNNNNESSRGTSNADAFSALETAMEWYEKESECCPAKLLLLKGSETLQRINEGVQWYSKKSVIIIHNDVLSRVAQTQKPLRSPASSLPEEQQQVIRSVTDLKARFLSSDRLAAEVDRQDERKNGSALKDEQSKVCTESDYTHAQKEMRK